MSPKTRRKPDEIRTRRWIINLLKEEGPSDSSALAGKLGISAMAVRQHLYGLRDEDIVTYEQQQRPIGRPAKLWRLTPSADRLFYDGHAKLAVDLLQSVVVTFGQDGLDQVLAERGRRLKRQYKSLIPKDGSLKERLQALVDIRRSDGYIAEYKEVGDGSFLFIENHCPIRAAAQVTSSKGICLLEQKLLSTSLGQKVHVERTEHMLEGKRRCAYLISQR